MRRVISRLRIRQAERDRDRRITAIVRRRMKFNALFRWLNSHKAVRIYPDKDKE